MNNTQLTAADKARALARFPSLRGPGGVRLSFVAFGPIVPARDPEALRRAAIDSLIGSASERSADSS
jgi:hypothetical protein